MNIKSILIDKEDLEKIKPYKWFKKGKHLHLGIYKTPIKAAQAYNIAAQKFFGNFASLNKS